MATLTARFFDYETLKTKLAPGSKVVVVSCDCCARLSDGLGGQVGLDRLADKLEADGFEVVRRELLPEACSAEELAERLEDKATAGAFAEADVVIPLACCAGIDLAGKEFGEDRLLVVTCTLGQGPCSPESGPRLTEPREGIEIQIDDPDGIPLADAAQRLGLFPGSF